MNTPLLLSYLAPLVICLGLSSVGCAGQGEEPAPGIDMGTGMGGAPIQDVGPCEEGEQKECSVTIYQANGTKSCFTGVEFCVEGEWSDCLEQ